MFVYPVTTVVRPTGGATTTVPRGYRPALVPPAVVPDGFSQALITSVAAPIIRNGFAYLAWTSSAPPGTWFQVYVDQALVYFGTVPSCTIAVPPVVSRVDIGTVPAGSQLIDYEESLPPAPARWALLTWDGGTFEAADIAGFHVYGGDAPFLPVNYGSVLATITAYPQSIITDGFGDGGFGDGGFGAAASSYDWTSGELIDGTWYFGVRPFDTAGNEGTTVECPVTIAAPPFDPPPFADNTRLHYTYDALDQEVTLAWNETTE